MSVTLQKTVVRAVLARIAVLCNEFKPNSVSPYGGAGKVLLASEPSAEVQVSFVNTKETIRLELYPTYEEFAEKPFSLQNQQPIPSDNP